MSSVSTAVTADLKSGERAHVAGRLHALDAARAGALVLGVFFHATMSFLPGPQLWVVRDVESPALAVVFYVAHMFRMSLFFLIAGFFARLLYHRLGPRGFIRNRLIRVSLPFVVFWPFVLAGMAGCFMWAASLTGVGLAELAKLQNASGQTSRGLNAIPLAHLWFLYVLTLLYVGALALRRLVTYIDRDGRFRAAVDRAILVALAPGGVLVLAVPVAVVMALRPNWQGWIGIQAPAIGLVPNPLAVVGYTWAFAVGWCLERQRVALLPMIERQWAFHLSAALLLTVLCLAHDGTRPILIPRAGTGSGPIFACLYGIAVWTWVLGIVGAALRFFAIERRAVRYVADASYWIYIVHLPVVMVFQVLVWPLSLPAFAKYILVAAGAFLVVLVSYALLVRRTVLGRWLNGRAYPGIR
jgi:peptidoglycan/LPS O-acetylase OafA/YrhL